MEGFVELLLLCGLIYYFFGYRTTNMVDVIQNRFQDVWNQTLNQTDGNGPRLLNSDLRRAGSTIQKKAVKNREQVRAIRNASLFRIKESEVSCPEPAKANFFLYHCCGNCTPSSRETLVNVASKQHAFSYKDLLVIPKRQTLLSKLFSHISYVYSFQKYDYPRVTQTVLEDERLKEAIKQAALEKCSNEGYSERDAYIKIQERARSILLNMQSSISDTLLRLVAWLLYKVLPCFIQSAAIRTQQLDLLKKANETGLPLVFLPLHRSHLDYVIISFLLLSNNIRNPLVAAGDNLRIPFFGWLMKGLGAFFIKRRIDPVIGRKDILYRATLHTYIMECLRAGHNLEFFVEGGRSRTGKPCMPKGGILSVVVDAYLDGTIEDALLVPMSINYERLVDGNFVREQLGKPKKMETFSSAVRALWATVKGNYGIVKVDVCQPFSLREMLKSFQQKQAIPPPVERQLKVTMSSSSLYGTDIVTEENRYVVDNIARHIVYDCSKTTPIMSTNVLAFVLLNKFRNGCTLENLVEAFNKTWQELQWGNRDVAFCGETVDIIDHALRILGPGLVQQQRQEITDIVDGEIVKTEIFIKPVAILPNVIELSYYSNTVLLHYVMDSILVTALYAIVQQAITDPKVIAENNITIKRKDLLDKAQIVCDILKYEFILYKPCQELESAIVASIENLISKGILSTKENYFVDEEVWSRRFAHHLEDNSDDELAREDKDSKLEYKLDLGTESLKLMEILHTLLRPLIDTYTYSAFSLRKLVSRSLSERDLIQEILSEIKTNLDRGTLNYGESLCVDPVKNSLKLFEKWDILECHPQENIKIYYLKEDFDKDSAANEVYEAIAAFKWTNKL